MKYKRLIYVAGSGSSVFESQVLEYLDRLVELGFFDEILLLCGNRSKQEKIHSRSFRVVNFKSWPAYNIFNFLQYYSLKKVLSKTILEESVIHIRAEKFTPHVKKIVSGLKVSNCKLVTDIRGAVLEETLVYKEFPLTLRYLKKKYFQKLRRNLDRSTDHVSVVSKKLGNYVEDHYGLPKKKISVNHSFASKYFKYCTNYRNEYRRKLNFKDDDIVFVFSTAGNANWQNTNSIVESIIRKGYKIINLSKKTFNRDNVINKFVPHEEVVKYLCAADIGVVWRNNDVVNQVASPVKFSEYICTGLPVISNNGVNLIEGYIRNTGFGKIISTFEVVNDRVVNSLLELDRERISETAHKKFHIDGAVRSYQAMYDNI